MITDWEKIGDIIDIMDTKELRRLLHPKIRERTVSIWISYSKTANVYCASIRRRDVQEGRRGSTVYTTPNKSQGQTIFAAMAIVEELYESRS